jgi:hypothetical protein
MTTGTADPVDGFFVLAEAACASMMSGPEEPASDGGLGPTAAPAALDPADAVVDDRVAEVGLFAAVRVLVDVGRADDAVLTALDPGGVVLWTAPTGSTDRVWVAWRTPLVTLALVVGRAGGAGEVWADELD